MPNKSLTIATLFLSIASVPFLSCRKTPSQAPDGTGLDTGNRYHHAFANFFLTKSKQHSESQREFVAIYYYNNFLQRLDMPSKSLFSHLTVDLSRNIADLQVWELPTKNPYSRDDILTNIAKGSDWLSRCYPTKHITIKSTSNINIVPSITAGNANSIYEATEKQCANSKVLKITTNEMSNCEWYGILDENSIGIVSRHDLEKSSQASAAATFDNMLNYGFTQYMSISNSSLTSPSTPPPSAARTQPLRGWSGYVGR